jgi:OFA family oxalate/formate antiporter-like MFS transporter
MTQQRVGNRWFVVVGAILVQLCLGAIYAWSVFTPILAEAGWSKVQTQGVFAAGLASFAVATVVAGQLMRRTGPRPLAWVGGIVLGAGYILAGLTGGTNFMATLLLIGIAGGFGIGLAYVVPIAVGMRWFPDKKGFITGLAVAGFGFGATIWVKLAGAWGHLLDRVGLGSTFMIYGAAFVVLVLVGGIWMRFPPEGWLPKGYDPTAPANGGSAATMPSHDFVTGEMLATPQYYLILLTMILSTGAGLMSIGLMKLFPMQALMAGGLDTAAASAVAGTAMAVFFSLANGIGRIVWGMVSDRLGAKRSIIIMTATQGLVVLAFQVMAGTPALLYLGAALIGFNFGGNFALFPMITAGTFGARNIGQLYGWVFLAYGIGGIAGPIMGGRLGDMGNFPLAFTICGVGCLAAAGLISLVRKPEGPEYPPALEARRPAGRIQ